MITLYVCSRGHFYNPEQNKMYDYGAEHRKRCGQVISYNVMDGNTYCRRVLKLKEMPDIYCHEHEGRMTILRYEDGKYKYWCYERLHGVWLRDE